MRYNLVRHYYGMDDVYVSASCAYVGVPVIWYYLNNKFSNQYYSYKSNLSFIGLDYEINKIINEILNFNNFKRLGDGTEVNVLSCIIPKFRDLGFYKSRLDCNDDESIAKAMLICTGYLKPTDGISKVVVEFYNEDNSILEFKAIIRNNLMDLYHIKDGEEEVIYLGKDVVDLAELKDDMAGFLDVDVDYISYDRSK